MISAVSKELLIMVEALENVLVALLLLSAEDDDAPCGLVSGLRLANLYGLYILRKWSLQNQRS